MCCLIRVSALHASYASVDERTVEQPSVKSVNSVVPDDALTCVGPMRNARSSSAAGSRPNVDHHVSRVLGSSWRCARSRRFSSSRGPWWVSARGQ